MIELLTPKQVRCEHCGFEFVITGFGSAAKIVCLACGKETTLSIPKLAPCLAGDKPELPAPASKSATETLLCSVEQCPLLTGSELGSAVAKQVRLHLYKQARQRRTILAWTVTLQVCVLLGVILFVVKSFLIPERESTASQVAQMIDKSGEPIVEWLPELVEPLPAVPKVRTAHNNDLSSAVTDPEYAETPLETVHQMFPPPVFETTMFDLPTSSHNTLTETPNSFPDPLPQPELTTLETANRLMETAKTTLATDPKESIRQTMHAAQIYEELGEAYPDSLYWIMGNAFASQSWGEPLLESSPVVETMTLSADNRYLLAQLQDKSVWLWDLQSPENERGGYLLDQGTAEYVKFVFSPDLHWIIGGQKNGTIRIWDMYRENPGSTLNTFVERVPDLQDLQISPNGQWLAAFGNAPQKDPITGIPLSDQAIRQIDYRPDRSDALPHTALLWNLRKMETSVIPMATPVPLMSEPIQIIRFSPNSDRLAIACRDSIVRIYDLEARGVSEEPFMLRGHQLNITQVVFSPCGQWMATGGQDNTVRLWNLTSSKSAPESVTLNGHTGWISALTIDQTGEYVFSGSYDRTIRIWHVKHSRISTSQPIVLRTNLGVPESLAITQDSDKMIVLGNEGGLGIYHLPSLLEDNPEDYYRAVTFRNSKLSISKNLVTTDNQLLIFSYEHLSDPQNNGIRLWALQELPSVQ